jgi:hypothetical protein
LGFVSALHINTTAVQQCLTDPEPFLDQASAIPLKKVEKKSSFEGFGSLLRSYLIFQVYGTPS